MRLPKLNVVSLPGKLCILIRLPICSFRFRRLRIKKLSGKHFIHRQLHEHIGIKFAFTEAVGIIHLHILRHVDFFFIVLIAPYRKLYTTAQYLESLVDITVPLKLKGLRQYIDSMTAILLHCLFPFLMIHRGIGEGKFLICEFVIVMVNIETDIF